MGEGKAYPLSDRLREAKIQYLRDGDLVLLSLVEHERSAPFELGWMFYRRQRSWPDVASAFKARHPEVALMHIDYTRSEYEQDPWRYAEENDLRDVYDEYVDTSWFMYEGELDD